MPPPAAPLPALPSPFPDYVVCPVCGEKEVEVWCYLPEALCHQCGAHIPHTPPSCLGSSPICAPFATHATAKLNQDK